MKFSARLRLETSESRREFESIPLIQKVVTSGASRAIYVDFLTQAYHHVKHTFPLLALAAAHTQDERYQQALLEYMNEERGHEHWILDDIAAMGGSADQIRHGKPSDPCRVMVGYAYYAIDRVSPYAMLGSVHVLEGIAIALADRVAAAVQKSLGCNDGSGFSYLRSHGAIDIDHVAFFESFVDGFTDPGIQDIVIDNSRIFYRLYGDIFRDLGTRHLEALHAA
jgi:pyrroloquinoline quinone (PQQ) biosynthesis protein C